MTERCRFCGEPATRLCDAPIGRTCYVGHPPRYLMEMSHRHDIAFKTVQMCKTITCDAPICDACAIRVYNEIDYCPDCVKRIKIKEAIAKRRTHK